MLNRNLDIQPTLGIRPGYAFNVLVNRTMILPPYRMRERWGCRRRWRGGGLASRMEAMSSRTKQPARKTAKASRRRAVVSAARAVESVARVPGVLLTGQALLDDMDAYRKQVTSSPEAAQSFLVRLGVLTKGGKAKTLIRG